MTVHGIGMQQHSYPSHSQHFVFGSAGLTIEEVELVAVDGITASTGEVGVEAAIARCESRDC